MSAQGYRFGISRLPSSGTSLRQQVQEYERAGFDFVAIGDHVHGGESPFATLAAAAMASERLRLRTYVINTGLWSPAFLAREAATLNQLSDGRLELGLGAGNAKSEFVEVGATWLPSVQRIARMRDMLLDVRHRLEDNDAASARRVPILIGAMSLNGLAVAAEHADIIAFSGLRHKTGHPVGALRGATPDETDELVAGVGDLVGERAFESDILLQSVRLGQDPLVAAKAWLEEDPDDMAFARTAADAAAVIEERRERWGFTSMTTFAHSSDALAEVMREFR